MRALAAAAQDALGRSLDAEGVAYAGRLDPLIVSDLFRVNGVEDTVENRAALRSAYVERLKSELESRPVTALEGTHAYINALRSAGATVGVLTGNFPESGELKLRSAGFSMDSFEVRVWGDESASDPPHRNDLPIVARERYEELRNERIDGGRVVVVGDTPGDVECARVNGHRCLAVTTGRFDEPALLRAGADLVSAGLGDTSELVAWTLGTRVCGGGTGR